MVKLREKEMQAVSILYILNLFSYQMSFLPFFLAPGICADRTHLGKHMNQMAIVNCWGGPPSTES